MTVEIAVFLPSILPDVSGCPTFTARQAIIEAAIEFCEKSGAWNEILDLIYLSAGSQVYELDLPKDSRALLVTNVWAANSELTPKTMAEIARLIPDWQTAEGMPAYYNQTNWEEFTVYPIPNNTDDVALTVRVSLAPIRTASYLPTFMVDRHFQAIVSGAKARLMANSGKAWTNLQLAAGHRAGFDAAIGAAKVEIFHERVQGNMRVAPRPFI